MVSRLTIDETSEVRADDLVTGRDEEPGRLGPNRLVFLHRQLHLDEALRAAAFADEGNPMVALTVNIFANDLVRAPKRRLVEGNPFRVELMRSGHVTDYPFPAAAETRRLPRAA
jgi:hypothetical protein